LRNSSISLNKSFEFSSPKNTQAEEGFQFQFKAQAKLEFNHFLRVLEYVAIKLYPEFDDDMAIHFVVERFLAPLLETGKERTEADTKAHLKRLMALLKDPAVVSFFLIVFNYRLIFLGN
jgi:hypothetical protein